VRCGECGGVPCQALWGWREGATGGLQREGLHPQHATALRQGRACCTLLVSVLLVCLVVPLRVAAGRVGTCRPVAAAASIARDVFNTCLHTQCASALSVNDLIQHRCLNTGAVERSRLHVGASC
jgi:hypothetical protein